VGRVEADREDPAAARRPDHRDPTLRAGIRDRQMPIREDLANLGGRDVVLGEVLLIVFVPQEEVDLARPCAPLTSLYDSV
jgi:hypothetical protein